MLEQHYKTSELAALLSCSETVIRDAALKGELKSIRVGADRRFSEIAVREWLERKDENVIDFDRLSRQTHSSNRIRRRRSA